jgi:hypothetical protein
MFFKDVGPCKDGAKKIPLLSIAKFSKKNFGSAHSKHGF